ncbi:hypothetical protein NM208_g4387 [Fusarium decemcellulare]|uniref:Uncharacterized protein n=1 Tax=Fusarium decemcellulare TaxID=57161 RepID=A0ACC1SKU9_9HYPO|nr:hypothetical protein NM208_g4387 [Fusarium decemcellulare]
MNTFTACCYPPHNPQHRVAFPICIDASFAKSASCPAPGTYNKPSPCPNALILARLSLVNTQMKPYTYSALENPREDIRLFELLPGSFDDDIKLRIFHSVLDPSLEKPHRPRIALQDLQRTLPPKWEVWETNEGRYIYINEEEEKWKTTWIHPDPSLRYLNEDTPDWEDSDDAQATRFEALSYVWGSTENPEEAFVESSSQPQTPETLFIGQNLASALRHLRLEKTPRTLWVDAICINQSDSAERENQVLRMADVYSLASRVVIWLGAATESTKKALDALQYLGAQVVLTTNNLRVRPPEAAAGDGWLTPSAKFPFDSETWEALDEFVNLEWHNRIWVVQEVTLANRHATIQIGHRRFPWSLFKRAITCLGSNNRQREAPDDKVLGMWNMICVVPKWWPISEIFRAFGQRKATDGRDKVYGLLALFSPSFRRRIQPHYDSSVIDVFTQLTVAHIEHTKRLELLPFWGPDLKLIGCPSWVGYLGLGAPSPVRRPLDFQFASLHSNCHARFRAPNKLTLLGVKAATLGAVKPDNRMPAKLWRKTYYQELLSCVRKAEPADLDHAAYITGESLREAYARTLAANYFNSRVPVRDDFGDIDTWMSQKSVNALFGEYAVDGASDVGSLTPYERKVLELLPGRALVRSVEGYFGLCPRTVEEGDLVVVFLGAHCPVVLRPQSDGNFQMLGQCYMHGLADGGAILGHLPKPWMTQIHMDRQSLINDWCYVNTETGERTKDDPRLSPLPDEWERIKVERTWDDPAEFEAFRHRDTHEVIKSDPRLSPEALKALGVELTEFTLV